MSQHDFDIANQGFPATRADLNNALQAAVSNSAGASAPSTTYAYQFWYDTSTNIIKMRNSDNDAWISIMTLDQTADAVTQINVDNIRIDGNTISSTDTNGNVTIDPAGTGDVIVASGHKLGVGKSSPVSPLDIEAADGVADNAYALRVQNLEATDDRSYGAYIQAGSTSVDDALHVYEHTGATSLFRVAGNGNVGIGTSSPARQLDVYDDGTNGQAVIAITAQNDENSRVMFADTDDNNIGILDYSHSDDSMRFVTNNSERMRIGSNGRVGIGNAAPNAMLHIDANSTAPVIRTTSSSSADQNHLNFRNNSEAEVGAILVTTTSTSYQTSSDHRLKEAVVDMTGAITRVKQLAPKRFNFIADDTVTVDGFLAHEAQTVVPEAVSGTHNETRAVTNAVLSSGGKLLAEDVAQADWTAGKLATTDDDGNAVDAIYPSDSTWSASHDEPVMQGIDQAKLVPLLTAALQESIAKIETLETQRADLEARLTALENA